MSKKKTYLVEVSEVGNEDFGRQVYILRQKRKLTGAQLARLVGVSQARISQIEGGEKPGEALRAKILKVLGK